MAKYRNYKFRYQDDLDRDFIKSQRVFLDNNETEITPITPLFLSRVVDSNLKVEGTSKQLRYVLSFIKVNNGERIGEYKINIPYHPLRETDLLKAHIREILQVERVICGDYYGESNITGGSGNGSN
jgi:hypothetical protein